MPVVFNQVHLYLDCHVAKYSAVCTPFILLRVHKYIISIDYYVSILCTLVTIKLAPNYLYVLNQYDCVCV